MEPPEVVRVPASCSGGGAWEVPGELVYRAWSEDQEPGAWSEDTGAWSQDTGAWSEDTGAWSEDTGAWSQDTGAWSEDQETAAGAELNLCSGFRPTL